MVVRKLPGQLQAPLKWGFLEVVAEHQPQEFVFAPQAAHRALAAALGLVVLGPLVQQEHPALRAQADPPAKAAPSIVVADRHSFKLLIPAEGCLKLRNFFGNRASQRAHLGGGRAGR